MFPKDVSKIFEGPSILSPYLQDVRGVSIPSRDEVRAWCEEIDDVCREALQTALRIPWQDEILDTLFGRLRTKDNSRRIIWRASLARLREKHPKHSVRLTHDDYLFLRWFAGEISSVLAQCDKPIPPPLAAALARIQERRNQMAAGNLRLVISVAQQYRGRGLSFPDLIQEGSIGLMRGIALYDYLRQTQLSTYVVWWIQQSIRRAIAEQVGDVRLPVHVKERQGKISDFVETFLNEHQRPPTVEEIAQALGMRVDHARAKDIGFVFLDEPAPFLDRGVTRGSVFSSTDPGSYEIAFARQRTEWVERLLSRARLKPREAEIIKRRFGLEGRTAQTLEAIGRELDLSRERIRQIEAEALQKLKRAGNRDRARRDDFLTL